MDLKTFYDACKFIGNKYSWIQGTGGNISVKTSDEIMLIKASGISISEISKGKSLVKINYKKLKEYNNSAEHEENSSLMSSILDDNTLRPSMETGFHVILGNTVIHTHPSSLCIFACMKNGEEKLRKILEEHFVWIPYVTPGQELSLEIKKKLVDEDVSKNLILILENHGLIVSSEDIEENLMINERVIGKTDSFLMKKEIAMFEEDNLVETDKGWKSNHPIIKKYLSLQNKCLVFPDAVVFGKKVFNKESKDIQIDNKSIWYRMDRKKAEKIHAIISLHMYLNTQINKLGTPKCLTENQVKTLLNMEEEKYRQNLLK